MSEAVFKFLDIALDFGIDYAADAAKSAAEASTAAAERYSAEAAAENEIAGELAYEGQSEAAQQAAQQAATYAANATAATQSANAYSSGVTAISAAGVAASGVLAGIEAGVNQDSAEEAAAAVVGALALAGAALAAGPAIAAGLAAVGIEEGLAATALGAVANGVLGYVENEAGHALGDLLEKLFGTGQDRSDPLVIDLTVNGLNLTALGSTSTYYDFSGDGFATQTGWVGTGSGFLVVKNADGSIKMLGNDSINGFAALAAAFGSSNGTITASSTLFSQLMVWEDANGNGQVDAGELYSLQDLGITSINLSETTSGEVINGNTVVATISYTMADGQTGVIGEVDFATDPTLSEPDTTVTVPADITSLPQLNGYGTLRDLQSAMTLDPTLLGLVQNFVALPTTSSTTTIDAAVQGILYEWAGVENVTPGSRGSAVDARQLAFLEAYLGKSYYQPSHGSPDPSAFGGADINEAWDDAFNALTARLVLQSPLASEIPEFQYDSALDLVLPTAGLGTSIQSLESRLGTPTQSNFDSWKLALQVIDASAIDLNLTSSELYQFISQVGTDATTQQVAALAAAVAAGQTISFAADGSFVISGTTLNDVMYAGSGISELIGNGGVAPGDNGEIYIGTNTDPLLGDEFVYNVGDGAVTIDEAPSVGPDNYPSQATLVLGDGITPDQVVLTQDSSGDVYIQVGSSGDSIKILNQRLSGTPNYDGVGSIVFSDGTTWTAQDLGSILDTGAPENTSLYGSQVASTFNSEGYAHYAQGYGAGDTFIYNQGYGALEINEKTSGSLVDNKLVLGSGIDPDNVTITAGESGAVVLTVGTVGDQITLDNMLNGPRYGVDTVVFADGTVWSAQNIVQNLTLAAGVSVGSYFDVAQLGDGNTQSSSVLPNLLYLGDATLSSLEFQADTAGDLTISTDGFAQDSIVLQDDLFGNAQSRVDEGLFADGSTITLGGADFTYTESGSGASQTLVGTGWGNNLFTSLATGDSITFGNGSLGGDDQNTIAFGYGSGVVTANPNGANWNTGTIVLGGSITASDVIFETDNAASGDLTLLLLQNGTLTGDSLTIDSEYNKGNDWAHAGKVIFGDGTTLNLHGNQDLLNTWYGDLGSTTLVGTDYGDNLFTSLATGDTITFGNGSLGGDDQNVANYSNGNGTVTISANGAGQRSYINLSGIEVSQLSFAESGNDLLIADGNSNDLLDIQNWFTGSSGNQITDIVDAVGDIVSSADINTLIAAMVAFEASINGGTSTEIAGDGTPSSTFVSTGFVATDTGTISTPFISETALLAIHSGVGIATT